MKFNRIKIAGELKPRRRLISGEEQPKQEIKKKISWL